MKVSFIIPAHNEESHLPATLRAIRQAIEQLSLDAETIVANDASTDDTPDIAAKHGAIVVTHQRRQISATRNLGAKAATGAVFIFIDADTIVNAQAIRSALGAIERGAVGGGGPIAMDGWIPRYARVMLWMVNTVFRLRRLTGGAFLFCTREAFVKAGGWSEAVYAGEEILLAQALKAHGRFVIVPEKVLTSGRKVRTYSLGEVLVFIARGAWGGQRFLAKRENLDLWYAPRRPDPGQKS